MYNVLQENARGGLNVFGNLARAPEYLNLLGDYCVNYGRWCLQNSTEG